MMVFKYEFGVFVVFGLFPSMLIRFFFHSLCKFSPFLVILITQDFTAINDLLLFLLDVWCNLLTSFEVASVTQEFNCHCCPSNSHSVSRWNMTELWKKKVWNISNYKREQRLKSLKSLEFWKAFNFEKVWRIKSLELWKA